MAKNIDYQVDVIIEGQRRDGRADPDMSALLRAFSVEPEVDGLYVSDIFVRELFQNIFDLASDPNAGKYDVRAEVEEVTLNAAILPCMEEALGGRENLDKLAEYRRYRSSEGSGNGFDSLLEGEEIKCTIVSDFTADCASKTKGMYGTSDPRHFGLSDSTDKSTFERYVLAAGYGDKAHSGSVGGHGIGKIANIIASRDNFVVVYTYTNEEEEGAAGAHKCICVGFDEHLDGASKGGSEAYKKYGPTTGAMYVGHHHSVSGKDGVRELRGELAKKLARAFGILPRDDGDFGTSICVFNSKISLGQIRDSYHKWFYPAHIGVQVEPQVRFSARLWNSEDRTKWKSVSFDHYPELAPFIRSYDLARGAEKPDSDRAEKLIQLRRTDFSASGSPGVVAFSVFDDMEEDEEPSAVRNKIALVRRFLVVNYYVPVQLRGMPFRSFAGVYLPGDAADLHDALAAAEPPKHHTWSLDQKRLTKLQVVIVQQVLDRIKSAYRSYVSALQPDDRLKDKKNQQLAQELGRFFSNTKGPGERVERLPSEVRVEHHIKSASANGGITTFKVNVAISASDNFNPEIHEFPVRVKVTPHFYPVGAVSREPLPVHFGQDEDFYVRASKLIELVSVDDMVELEVETKTSATEVECKVAAEIV